MEKTKKRITIKLPKRGLYIKIGYALKKARRVQIEGNASVARSC